MRQLLTKKFPFKPTLVRTRLVPARLILCFFLLFAQSAVLLHSHDGDLQQQFDCEICLKVNSTDHAIASSSIDFVLPKTFTAFALPQLDAITPALPAFRARAPPALI